MPPAIARQPCPPRCFRPRRAAAWVVAWCAAWCLAWWSPARGDDELGSVAPAPHSSPAARLVDDAQDGRFDQFELLEAAWIAGEDQGSSSGDPELARIRHLLAREAVALQHLPPERRATEILARLRTTVLTGPYLDAAASVAGTCRGAAQNCLTATILFVAAARAAGLEARAVEFPGHVRAEVLCGPRWLAIETTAIESRAMVAGGAASSEMLARRILNDVKLVAAVYYNRGCQELAAGHYREAVAHNLLARELDPTATRAEHNALAAWNHWASDEVARGQYPRAAGVLHRARRHHPEHPILAANLRWIYGRWAAEHALAGRAADSLRVLGEGARSLFRSGERPSGRGAARRPN